MFCLNRPCADCPFLKDGHMLRSLGNGRIEEILKNVIHEDGFFSCHKTIDYSKETERLQKENKFCAGALIAIEKAGATYWNRNTRIAVGFGLYDPSELKGKDEVINPKDYIRLKG